MSEQREKLIELVAKALDAPNERNEKGLWKESKEHISDYLLENGVVVLPCRCCECEHCDIGQNDVEQWCVCQVKRIDVDPTDFCSYAKRKGGDE